MFVIAPIVLLAFCVVFFRNLSVVFHSANLQNIGYAVGLFLLAAMLISLRYWLLLDKVVPFSRLFRSDGLAYFIVQFIPIPAQVFRVTSLYLSTQTDSGWVSAKAVLDFMLNTFMRLLAAVLVIMLLSSNSVHLRIILPSITLLGMTGVLIWLYRNPNMVEDKMGRILKRVPFIKDESATTFTKGLAEALKSVRGGQLAVAWLISMVTWALFALVFYQGLLALNLHLNANQALISVFLALTLSPPSGPLMIVFQQVVVTLGLRTLGYMSSDQAVGYSLLMQGVQVFFWLLVGTWAILSTNVRLKELAETAEKMTKKEGAELVSFQDQIS
jgi:uncharacterized membrane protein